MKKHVVFIMSFTVIISMILSGMAFAADINVEINGTKVQFDSQSGAPFVDSSSRTQVPLRVTMEKYGATVSWDASNKTASVSKDGTTVKVPVGQSYIVKNGTAIYNDTAAVIKDGRTYLPIRAVLEAFGATVGWESATKTVTVASPGYVPAPKPATPASSPSKSDTTVQPGSSTVPSTATYIGNASTKKFHYASCSSVKQMKASNKVALSSRTSAIAAGYVPCARCNP